MDNNQTTTGEVNALKPIGKDERMSWVSLAFVQAGICVCVPSFLEGALLASAMPVKEAFWSGTIGYVLVVIVMTILGFMGSDLGLASCTLTEQTFGKKGARYIVSLLFAINLIGWFGINNQQCGEAFTNFMYASYGIQIPVVISCIVWGIVMLLTAVYGMKAIEKLDIIAIPLLLIVMGVGTYMAIKKFGLDELYTPLPRTMTFMQGIGLSFDFYAVGTITAADITRFQRSRKDTILSTLLGVFPMGVLTLGMGIMLTKIANDYDIGSVLITVGIPLFGVISLILSTWTTNTSNVYSAGLNLVMSFNIKDNKRQQVTIIAGIIGIVLGVLGILNHIEEALNFLAYLVCPIGGIMFAEYFIIGKGDPSKWSSRDGWNIPGVISWALSIIIAYYFKVDYFGILAGVILYLIFYKVLPAYTLEIGGKNEKTNIN